MAKATTRPRAQRAPRSTEPSAPLPDPQFDPDGHYSAAVEVIRESLGEDFALRFDEAVGARLARYKDAREAVEQRTSSLLAKLLDLDSDELRHVENLIDSLASVSDLDCAQCGRPVARSELARHLIVCAGPHEEPVDEYTAYSEALDRLQDALEAAGGVDRRLVIDVDNASSDLLHDMLDRERAGELAAVSRMVGG